MFDKCIRCFVLMAVCSSQAFAHSIFLDCKANDSEVECKGSFSDGSAADNLPVEVISYDDELIVQGKTDSEASFTFTSPNQDFYILMDAGPGHVVEVDMQDIR